MKFVMLLVVSTLVSTAAFGQLVKNYLDLQLIQAKKFIVLDFDGDYDMDVVAAANDITGGPIFVAWYKQEANGSFTKYTVSTTDNGARSVAAANLTGDSRKEIVVGSVVNPANPVRYYQANTNPPADSWTGNDIDASSDSAYAVFAVDLNEDGNIDVLSTSFGVGSNGRVFWNRNNGGGSFTRIAIDEGLAGPSDVLAADLDNDGDLDIITNEYLSDIISYYVNDGSENFTRGVLTSTFNGPNGMDVGDFDGDGRLDIVGVSYLDDKVSWWRNTTSGALSFGTENIARAGFGRGRSVQVVDFNGDGIPDLVGAAELADQIVTLTNDGAGNFTNTIVSDTIDFAYYADAADMDGDGDYDILGSSFNLNQLIWWATTQTEDNTIAAGDAAPQSYYSGNVVIDFSASDQSENVSVFYNAGAVPDRASFDTGIDHLATRGFYTVTTPKTNYTASIDFAYGSANVTEWASITDENDLVILVFSKTNDRWEIAGTSQNINTGANVITVNGISSEFDRYSRWTIGSISTDNPLPVQLAGFGARSLPTGVSLSWNTASELNNLGFELYRASDQQTDFQLVASYTRDHELIGHGNSSQENSYRFLDSRVESGRQYEYKLVSVDMDGTRWENARTSVFFDGSQEILTFQLHQNYPNPFNGVTQIPFTLERTDARGKLEIFDVLGRKIRSFYFHGLDAGLHTIAWDAMDENGTAVGSGQYMYVLTVGEQRLSNRLIYVK